MQEGLIKITPDPERVKSMIKMAETTLAMIETINQEEFASNIIKEYYEVIRELINTIMLKEGYKTYGEGAHKKAIEYIEKYKEFNQNEIILIEDLRVIRNKIAYEGFFIQKEDIQNRLPDIKRVIKKLQKIILKKL